MRRIIQNDEGNVIYTLKKFRSSRCVRFIVHNDGSLVVTCPRYTPVYQVEKLIHEKIAWIREKMHTVHVSQVPIPSRRDYAIFRFRSRERVEAIIRKIDPVGRFVFSKIAIGRPKTRWGSCSSRGTLTFHYGILFVPDCLAEYIVVHELCHLEEMNHSQRFWFTVAEFIPDWRERRKNLRMYDSARTKPI